MTYRLISCLICIFQLLSYVSAADRHAPLSPSENAGRIGLYQVPIGTGDQCYTVYAPSTYSETAPAGLYVYLHGMRSAESAKAVPNKDLCDQLNLIGISPSYPNLDLNESQAPRSEIVRQAIRQVCKDYRILLGRGIISSFSAGGAVHGQLYQDAKGIHGPDYPFNLSMTFGSSWRGGAQGPINGCAWLFSVGSDEYQTSGRGSRMLACSTNRFNSVLKGSVPEVFFRIIKNGGHKVHRETFTDAIAAFKRTELAVSPILCTEGLPKNKTLQKAVHQANSLQLGAAIKTIQKILKKDADTPIGLSAKHLQVKIEERVKAQHTLVDELSTVDTHLATWYCTTFSKQQKGMESAKELKGRLKSMKKDYSTSLKAYMILAKNLNTIFAQGCSIDGKNEKTLNQIKDILKDSSLLVPQIKEFLSYVTH